MITITENITPTQFIDAIYDNNLHKTDIETTTLTGDLITNFNSNFDYLQTIYPSIVNKTPITVGMSGAAYIAALNSNFTKVFAQMPYEKYNVPDNEGSEYNIVSDINHGPALLKLANGTHLISCMKRGGIGYNRDNFTVIRGADGNYSTPNLIGHDEISDGTYDSHGKASFVEKSGIIYGVHEVYRGVGETKNGPHNSDIIVIKSEDGGSTWTEITRVLGYHSYPQIVVVGSNIYLIARTASNDTSGFPFYFSIWSSNDNCETWTALPKVYQAASNVYTYKDIIINGSELNLIIMDRVTSGDGTFATYPYVFHVRTTDGITWYNSAKTWSKNVQTGGYITTAEGKANCLIGTYTNDTYSSQYQGGFIKDDKLYSLISYGQCSAATTDAGLGLGKTVYDSCKLYEGAAELLDLSALVTDFTYECYTAQFLRLMRNGDTFDIIQTNDKDGTDIKLHNYNTEALISTKILRLGISDVHGQQYGANTYQSTERSGRLIVIAKLTGSWYDLYDAYADLVIFET